MDDNEYYEKMRNHNLNRSAFTTKKNKPDYSKWKITQGREDAEMLLEKNSSSSLEDKPAEEE